MTNVFYKNAALFRKIFWGVVILLLLSGLVAWQLSEKRLTDSSGEQSWFSYPLADYEILTQTKQVNREQIDEVLKPYIGQSFWDLPLPEIQSKLMRLDWVVSAKVSRNWPDLLGVVITEQEAIARWGENGLVNQSGEVFYPTSMDGYDDYVLLDGDLQFAVLVSQRFSEIAPLFSQHDLWIESLVLLDEQVWELQIFQGPLIRFSEGVWREEIERFLLAYPELKSDFRNSAVYYDLRYSNGFVMKPNKTN
ncbi:cell division protein FtsQ/DivIB [Thiomicrorhabdus indica]|uniref:cell division protein FtsQ/DivIB n=1 Tax=Thiomicrorhabdus indica TaxID=2267253 RepID=UPI00102D893C|nr:FtsQ-type POTRA domain-containing protein [Thiomicrorhabdus indica]